MRTMTIETIETTKTVRREGEYPCSPEGHMHALWVDHIKLNHRLNPNPCTQPGAQCSGKL